jgi:integrase
VYSKADGKKIRKLFAGKGAIAAARLWRIDAMKGVKDKKLRAPSPRTLHEECDDFLAGARTGGILNRRKQIYKPGVIREYERALRLRVYPGLGDRRLDSIDRADLLELQEQLQGQGCGASVIRNTMVPVQAVFRRAMRRQVIGSNPALDLELPVAGTRDRAATPEQARELLAVLDGIEAAILATAFYSGLRLGEIQALRVGDVNLDTATVTVERSWDVKEGPVAPKSRAGTRTVFILDALRPYLEPLVQGRAPGELVFGAGPDIAFDRRAVSRKAERAYAAVEKTREAPLTRFTAHEARHSFSTWMDHAGISEARADRLMGHAGTGVAARYRHRLDEQFTRDRETLDQWLAGTPAEVRQIGGTVAEAPAATTLAAGASIG